MQEKHAEYTTEVVIFDVTLENVQDQLRRAGVRPGQLVDLQIIDSGKELLRVMDRVSDRTEQLGLTEDELKRNLS